MVLNMSCEITHRPNECATKKQKQQQQRRATPSPLPLQNHPVARVWNPVVGAVRFATAQRRPSPGAWSLLNLRADSGKSKVENSEVPKMYQNVI